MNSPLKKKNSKQAAPAFCYPDFVTPMRRRHGKGTRTACPLKTAHRNRYATSTLTPSSAAKTHLRPEAEAAVRLRPLRAALSFDVDKIRKPLSCEAVNAPVAIRQNAGRRGAASPPPAGGGFSRPPAPPPAGRHAVPRRPADSAALRRSAAASGRDGLISRTDDFAGVGQPLAEAA